MPRKWGEIPPPGEKHQAEISGVFKRAIDESQKPVTPSSPVKKEGKIIPFPVPSGENKG